MYVDDGEKVVVVSSSVVVGVGVGSSVDVGVSVSVGSSVVDSSSVEVGVSVSVGSSVMLLEDSSVDVGVGSSVSVGSSSPPPPSDGSKLEEGVSVALLERDPDDIDAVGLCVCDPCHVIILVVVVDVSLLYEELQPSPSIGVEDGS